MIKIKSLVIGCIALISFASAQISFAQNGEGLVGAAVIGVAVIDVAACEAMCTKSKGTMTSCSSIPNSTNCKCSCSSN